MKIAVLILGAIVLVACAGGLFVTYQSLASTQETLEETRETLQDTQTQLRDTADSLEITQTELQDTADNLEETRQALDEQKALTENYVQLHESGLEKIDELEDELDSVNDKYRSIQKVNDDLRDTIDDLQSQLDLYTDTLGTQVFSGVQPPYKSGNVEQLSLVNQGSAQNPTWSELEQFLRDDKTDSNPYIEKVYECGNYAQDLHNSAEAAGIRTAFVAVHFYEGASHALNAFKTVDRGLVYIDVTGFENNHSISNLDKLVEITKDEPYTQEFLFPQAWYLVPDDRPVKSIEIYW